MDRGADEPIESLTGLEVEVVAVCVAHERAKAFEQTGHPPADGVQQLRELGASRPWCPMKRRAASFEIVHPVEKEHMGLPLVDPELLPVVTVRRDQRAAADQRAHLVEDPRLLVLQEVGLSLLDAMLHLRL